MSDGGAICWPEQYPGEYNDRKKIWDDADRRWPERNRSCRCRDNDPLVPCKHCGICGRFVSNIRMHGNEFIGILVVIGDCKNHGEQCLDGLHWLPEFFMEETT